MFLMIQMQPRPRSWLAGFLLGLLLGGGLVLAFV